MSHRAVGFRRCRDDRDQLLARRFALPRSVSDNSSIGRTWTATNFVIQTVNVADVNDFESSSEGFGSDSCDTEATCEHLLMDTVGLVDTNECSIVT